MSNYALLKAKSVLMVFETIQTTVGKVFVLSISLTEDFSWAADQFIKYINILIFHNYNK